MPLHFVVPEDKWAFLEEFNFFEHRDLHSSTINFKFKFKFEFFLARWIAGGTSK